MRLYDKGDGYCYNFTSPNLRFDEYRFSGLPDKKPNPNLFSLSPRKLTPRDYYLLDRMASTIIAALEQIFFCKGLSRKETIEPSAPYTGAQLRGAERSGGVVKDKTCTLYDGHYNKFP